MGPFRLIHSSITIPDRGLHCPVPTTFPTSYDFTHFVGDAASRLDDPPSDTVTLTGLPFVEAKPA